MTATTSVVQVVAVQFYNNYVEYISVQRTYLL